MKALLMEFVGTSFLILTFGLTVVPPGVGPFAPIAIGMVLAAMISVARPVSGGHFNPSITLAVWLRQQMPGRVALFYVVVQLVAGAVAGILVNYFRTDGVAPSTTPAVHDLVKLGLVEFIFTFALVYVFMTSARWSGDAGNCASGFAVGVTMLAGIYAGLPLSGGAYNPAISVGTSVVGLGNWSLIWLYFIAQLAGGAVAALMNRFANPDELRT
jgi:aquaporin Z